MATKQHHRIERQKDSISRLEKQLADGFKILSTNTAKKYEGKKKGDKVPLNDSDIKRIKDVISATHLNMKGSSVL